MKLYLIAPALLLCHLFAAGQQVIDVTKGQATEDFTGSFSTSMNGQIMSPTKFVRLTSGTPYFQEQFMKGRLIDAKGTAYASKSVRLNLLDNEVNFLDPGTGQELIATLSFKQIQLLDSATGTRYTFILGDQLPSADKSLSSTFLQVLVNDKVSLCRQIKKTLQEFNVYNSPVREQSILTQDVYYLQIKGSFIHIKSWPELQDNFKDKKPALDQYIHEHHLKGKSVEDYTDLVKYYNQISSMEKG